MNDRGSYQKSETRRENRNVPDFSDLSPTILDSRYLWFRVFILRKIWHCWEKVKLPAVLDFPYIWKPGIVTEVAGTAINDRRGDRTVLIFLYCFLSLLGYQPKVKDFLKMFFSFLSAQEKGLRLSSSFKCLNSKVKQKKHCAFNKI